MEGPLLPMGEKEKYDDCPETVLNYARSRNGLDTLYFYYGSKYVTFSKGRQLEMEFWTILLIFERNFYYGSKYVTFLKGRQLEMEFCTILFILERNRGYKKCFILYFIFYRDRERFGSFCIQSLY